MSQSISHFGAGRVCFLSTAPHIAWTPWICRASCSLHQLNSFQDSSWQYLLMLTKMYFSSCLSCLTKTKQTTVLYCCLSRRDWESFAGFFWVGIIESQHALGLLSCWSSSGEEWIQWEPYAQQCTLCAEKVQATPWSSAHAQICPMSNLVVIQFTKWAKLGAFPHPISLSIWLLWWGQSCYFWLVVL